ncbi:LOW QUALITY PROTEIN: putative UDP-rhamnose:rhamnosyltransferase 1, partial [Solanum pennellii]|uniref:LOW QUALITY PROTEIN: putative UDP-rhamnose:rhamnosyltransferase 1 n=1 Tax=Solanum pennellii TaxID=28526 RepID=A0ABM1UZD0_SOLPN
MAKGNESNTKKLHIVMFPWLAFGHIIPFLELSKFIARKGHKISFISTPKNIDRLPKLPSEFSNSMRRGGWWSLVKNVSGVSDFYRVGVTINRADAIIIRHCNEFEGQWLKLLEDLHHTPVLPTGLMPSIVKTSTDEKNESWLSIEEWLDRNQKGLVVYVALGSEVTITQSEINELARGLELSGSPFFWVLRKPTGSGNIDPIELPNGFEERTKDRGIVWNSWVPQLKILSHESIGGFLTHYGWGSTIEGLMFGHPLIMLPFLCDQGLNARILEDKEDGSYTSDSVAHSVKLVMIGNDGKIIREKAKEREEL